MNDDQLDEETKKTVKADRAYGEEQFDKLIVSLASGALVLTVGFSKDIIQITKNTDTRLLQGSWIAFTVTLFLILIAQRISVTAFDRILANKIKGAHQWDTITKVLNLGSIGTLIIGVTFFLIFVSNNLK